MIRNVIRRDEMHGATLRLGGTPIALNDYATTGIIAVAVGPRGTGKTNTGLLMAEQLSEQGWVSVLVDPEGELESLYGKSVGSPAALGEVLGKREAPMVVVSARDAHEFIPFGRELLAAADRHRRPVFVVIDEGQIFSASRRRSNGIGEAADIIAEIAERGRKRAIDLFITASRFTGTLQRTVFANKNLTFIAGVEDPTAWSALAPLFKASGIGFGDLNTLSPGEFFCFSRRGVEKVRMPMAAALKEVATEARPAAKSQPATFRQWDEAMRLIPKDRLLALDEEVVSLLAAVAELPAQQVLEGKTALKDEIERRRKPVPKGEGEGHR